MNLVWISVVVFGVAYLLNIFYITVLYHRGLAHGAVTLHPATRRWVIWTGSWVTGIDPKAWACMHRLHHLHSDTVLDPHSPWNQGVFGVMTGQLASYERALRALILGRREMSEVVSDLDFPVNWVNRGGRWWLPHALHLAIALGLSLMSGAWYLGPAYWLGMMSHPIQGWMVNSLAHRYGYRNFESADQSRNNSVVAWLVMGEGYQNNHHADPASAKFSVKWFELDGGYALCWLAARAGVLSLPARRFSSPALIPAKT